MKIFYISEASQIEQFHDIQMVLEVRRATCFSQQVSYQNDYYIFNQYVTERGK
jgi:hypothetical protein